MAPKDYHLICTTMSCSACENAIESAIKDLPNVTAVKADAKTGTVVVTAASCNSCEDCKCCKCDPCKCLVCRCCRCGVDKYMATIEKAGHKATYPGSSSATFGTLKFDLPVVLALEAACLAVGYMIGKKK